MTAMLRQFTGVAISGRAMLITGATGIGKSSLALALIDRGARLVGDDGVALEMREGVLYASPAPATRGLMEVRGVGIVPMPVAEQVPVALIVRLSTDGPRYVEDSPHEAVLGTSLPVITLWPDASVLPLRAELALSRHGLTFPT
ncbi:MAG: HPr kinase/phosphatase C-terminal domain-containing protein [Sphingomonadales bacterium]|nr:HPr kinase/phosphatase C-terminal domain-containing protein [Sphingomonadales bacterium]MDE2168616.1 HPr kinase/phosphatase C-terminal domain-containing protein [Sphingomonadales bacterium]